MHLRPTRDCPVIVKRYFKSFQIDSDAGSVLSQDAKTLLAMIYRLCFLQWQAFVKYLRGSPAAAAAEHLALFYLLRQRCPEALTAHSQLAKAGQLSSMIGWSQLGASNDDAYFHRNV